MQVSEGPYPWLGRLAAIFVNADAERLGIQIRSHGSQDLKPTPFNPDFSCEGCAAAEKISEG
jgi:hypothetical protein